MKRETLERNLKLVISRIEAGIPPVHITEVLGFGSFFRPKKNPGDIDTIIFYKTDPEFDKVVNRFSRLFEVLRKTEEGRKIIEDSISNQQHQNVVDVWMKYTKVSGFMRTYYGDYNFDRVNVTKKILREGIRGIGISEVRNIEDKDVFLRSMPTQSYKLVWSEDERDVDKNLHQTPEEQVALILAEMKNFVIQVERYKSYYYVLSNVSKWVIETIQVHRSLPDKEQITKKVQTVGSERGILEPYLKWILNWGVFAKTGFDEPRYNEKATHLDIESEVAKIEVSVNNISELGVLCESLRGEINEYKSRCAVARWFLLSVIDTVRYSPPIEERIARCAMWALNDVPLNKAKDDTKRWVLSDLGLDDISRNIVLVERKRGGTTYRLADSEEDLKELIERSKKGKMAKEYEKYIRALARKVFPKDTLIRTFFTISMGENVVPILEKVGLDVLSRDLDVADFDKLLQIVKKLGFIIKPESRVDPDHFTAEIDIDTSKLNGDKKLIKKLLESKLSLSSSNKS